MPKLIKHEHSTLEKEYYVFWCPGCQRPHQYTVTPGRGDGWGFNGSMESPTFTPSLLNWCDTSRCHLFLTDGKIQYLGDCSHALAGQTIDLVETSESGWLPEY